MTPDYPHEYEHALRYSSTPGADHATTDAMLRRLAEPDHFHTRLGLPTGDQTLRGAAADALRDTDRHAEADLVQSGHAVGVQDGQVRPLRHSDLPPFHREYIRTALGESPLTVDEGDNPDDAREPREEEIHPDTLVEMAREAEEFRHRHKVDPNSWVSGRQFFNARNRRGPAVLSRFPGEHQPGPIHADATRYGQYRLRWGDDNRLHGVRAGD